MVTQSPLVPTICQVLLYGLGPYFEIENIYAAHKVGEWMFLYLGKEEWPSFDLLMVYINCSILFRGKDRSYHLDWPDGLCPLLDWFLNVKHDTFKKVMLISLSSSSDFRKRQRISKVGE